MFFTTHNLEDTARSRSCVCTSKNLITRAKWTGEQLSQPIKFTDYTQVELKIRLLRARLNPRIIWRAQSESGLRIFISGGAKDKAIKHAQ
jgi:hypothetical protein